jgi:mono/diheme cytochrome c family protein
MKLERIWRLDLRAWLVLGVLGLVSLGCETPPPDGRAVFLTVGCARCHGNTGAGESLGPPLEDLSTKFTIKQMNAFLDNPIAYAEKDERLSKWRDEYFTPMPKLQMNDPQRDALVAYLFEKHP